MTFCMAFAASPDGIAVISDTRITWASGFNDGFQKIIFPMQNSFISGAGSVGTLLFVLKDVSGFLQKTAPNARLDAVRNRLRARLREWARSGQAKGPDDAASIIYGDLSLSKGPARCRLMRFDLAFSDSGVPMLNEQTGASFSAEESRKFPEDPLAKELPWLCIGTIDGTRNFIGNTAMDHVRQLLARGLEIHTGIDKEAIKARGRVYQSVDIRGTSKPYGTSAALFDMAGPSDGTFRKKLRAFAKEEETSGKAVTFDVIQLVGMAALKRIELLVAEMPGFIGSDDVGDIWTLATISRAAGLRLVAGNDPNGVTLPFGLKSGLD